MRSTPASRPRRRWRSRRPTAGSPPATRGRSWRSLAGDPCPGWFRVDERRVSEPSVVTEPAVGFAPVTATWMMMLGMAFPPLSVRAALSVSVEPIASGPGAASDTSRLAPASDGGGLTVTVRFEAARELAVARGELEDVRAGQREEGARGGVVRVGKGDSPGTADLAP